MFKKKIILVLGMLILCSVALYFVKNFQAKSYEKLSNVDSQHSLTSGTQEEKAPQSTEVNNTGSSNSSTEATAVSSGNTAETGSENSNKDGAAGNSGSSNTVSFPKAEATPVPTAAPSNQPSSTPAPVSTPAPTPVSTPTPTPTPVQNTNFKVIDMTTNRIICQDYINYDGKTSVMAYTRSMLNKAGITCYPNTGGYLAVIDNLSAKGSSGWLYYINEDTPNIGADQYIPKSNDIVTWRYWKDALNKKN